MEIGVKTVVIWRNGWERVGIDWEEAQGSFLGLEMILDFDLDGDCMYKIINCP